VDHLLATKEWDFFMLVEIGVDRIHHGFWSYHDPAHKRYVRGNPYENAIHDYYVRIDGKIGEWLGRLDKDVCVLVVSDHGAKAMQGGICLNEWLWREGYLAFEEDPPAGSTVPLEKLKVDWSRTRAWGSGGYYGRVYMNVRDREPHGVIAPNNYERAREELATQLKSIPGFEGEDICTKIFKPEEIYREVKGIAPDLLVYFGDLSWRSIGTIGYGAYQVFENDTGPDDCNHAQNGMFVFYDPVNAGHGTEVKGAQLMDVGYTVLETEGVPIPDNYQGRSLLPE
jgi:predicted AlkP superfamily phosphohydrolase/phosphomutase